MQSVMLVTSYLMPDHKRLSHLLQAPNILIVLGRISSQQSRSETRLQEQLPQQMQDTAH